MTTIVYSNGILATDSRRTRSTTYHEAQCESCNSKVVIRLLDTAAKIHLMPKGILFNDERTIAVATTGNITLLTALLDSVKNNSDPIKDYKLYKKYSPEADKDKRSAGLVIATTVSIFKLHFDIVKQSVERFELDCDLSVGAAKTTSDFYLRMIKRDPVQAIIAAMCVDKHTGGNVDWVHIGKAINQPDNEPIVIQSHETDMNAFALSMKQHGDSPCNTNPTRE